MAAADSHFRGRGLYSAGRMKRIDDPSPIGRQPFTRSLAMKFWTLCAVLAIAAAGAFAPATSALAAEPIAFTLKFPPGQIDRQTNSMEMDQTVSSDVLPAPQKQSMKMSAKTTLKQIKSDATGSLVEVTYDGVKMSGSMFAQAASDALDKTLAAFVGEKITLHFTPKGKVDKVDGIDAIVAKLPAGAGQAAIKQFLNEDRIKEQYNVAAAQVMPTKPVSIGDTWETDVSHNLSAVEVKIKSQVKFVGIDEREGHKIAKLEFSGKGTLQGALAPGAPKMNFDQLGQTGTAEFDLTRGWLTSQIVDQHMKGDMKLNIGANPVSMKIDQTVKATTTLTAAKPETAKK
jgi:hypothetical protein